MFSANMNKKKVKFNSVIDYNDSTKSSESDELNRSDELTTSEDLTGSDELIDSDTELNIDNQVKPYTDHITNTQTDTAIESQADPTDIYDEDETEIINQNANILDELDINDPSTNTIKNVYEMFISKYDHLDNFKSRSIILNICKIVVSAMPDFYDKPYLYIRFIESYINQNKLYQIDPTNDDTFITNDD